MKKKILGGLAILTVAVVTAFNVSVNSQSNNSYSLSMENVEALAGEHDSLNCPRGSIHCATVNSPNGTHKYYKK